MSVGYLAVSILEGIFTVFHFSFIYFLIYQRKCNNRLFASSFYLLYIVSGVISLVYVINDFYTWKLSHIEAFRPFYESNPKFVSIAYLINGYTFHAICFCYTIITYNRFKMLQNSPTLKPVWSPNTTIKVCIIMVCFPMTIVAHRFFFPAKYVFDESGTINITHEDAGVARITYLINVVFDFFNLIPTMVLNYFSYIKYKKLLKAKVHNTSMHEAKLVFHSIYSCLCFTLVFAFEVAYLVTTIAHTPVFNGIVQYVVPVMVTAYLLAGSVFLLVISKPLRHEYFRFYHLSGICPALRNQVSQVTPLNWRSETYI